MLKPSSSKDDDVSTSLIPIVKAIGYSPGQRDNSSKRGSLALKELRKQSSPGATSSQQSPMQASVSSYLKFQRFSREIGPSANQVAVSGAYQVVYVSKRE